MKKNLKLLLCIFSLKSPSQAIVNEALIKEHEPYSACTIHRALSNSRSNNNGYEAWASNQSTIAKYPQSIYIPMKTDPCTGMAIHWNIQKNVGQNQGDLVSMKGNRHHESMSGTLHVAMAVEVSNGRGWVALGFSETGGMKGADLVYFETSTGKLTDAYVMDGYVTPSDDTVNDWTLHQVVELVDDGILIVEASRPLDTKDALHDHKLVDDSNVYVTDTILIGAWGDGDLYYHGAKRVSSSVQLFPGGEGTGNPRVAFEKDMQERAKDSVTLQLDNYEIPTNETTYHQVCYTYNALVSNGLFSMSDTNLTYVLGFDFNIAPQSVPHVHHMLVYGHLPAYNSPDECNPTVMVPILGWTPGNDYFHFHSGGFEIQNTFNALTFEYHFDNPGGVPGVIDNGTGVDIYYSNDPVELEVGMFVVGDPTLALIGEPVGNGKVKHEFMCPESCTESTMESDEITILFESLHMHQAGKRMATEIIRNDAIINIAEIDYYDFYQRGSAPVRQEPYIVKKGDRFRTSCYYDSNDERVFGLGSRNEMCMSFLYYYPKQNDFYFCGPGDPLLPCSATHSNATLASDDNFDRDFGMTSFQNYESSAVITSFAWHFSLFSSVALMLIV